MFYRPSFHIAVVAAVTASVWGVVPHYCGCLSNYPHNCSVHYRKQRPRETIINHNQTTTATLPLSLFVVPG